ncbi:MAG: EamA family transporter [Deltaproteobacteria bacterium]|jgi:drug/metabolite transporter (DMT)-like permease|nr:EamA family transporter [Deltaproteobacteria bacterium]MBW1747513.1 EamA family transporter [Deltaproteobacteria bacterium]MBW1825586.1 EamA family transporter [Deltaproteobacteria bacterium]MBW1968476.1 EamA family transporter [Deltaproteobacteria bacterium]MBW2155242.1 EamA family transporter [Deltaproteobacteria bacterium]
MKSNESVKDYRWGYLYVVTAAVMWGLSGSSAKFLFNSGITPYQLVQLRLTISTGLLFLWLLIRHRSLLKIDRKDILYFVLFGTVGMAGVQFTYLFTISKIKVAAAILLQYLAPSFIAIHSVVFMRDKLSPVTIMALVGATFGCYLVVGAYNLEILSMNIIGIISGILSAVTFAWYSVHGEYGMRRYNPWTVLFFALFFGALVWNVLHPPLEAFMHDYSRVQWVWILYIGILGTLVPFGLYLEGINLIRSTRASITATLEPITAGIISYIFLNEIMEAAQITGGAIIIASIICLQLNQEQDEKAPGIIRARNHTDE